MGEKIKPSEEQEIAKLIALFKDAATVTGRLARYFDRYIKFGLGEDEKPKEPKKPSSEKKTEVKESDDSGTGVSKKSDSKGAEGA